MGLLIAVALVVWMLHKAVNDGRIDHTYAKQGLVSPRLEAKYGGAAVEKTRRYGLASYIADAWSDLWQRRTAATFAARNLKVTKPGEPVRWRDRWATARRVATTGYHRLVDPVGEPRPAAEPVAADPPVTPAAPVTPVATPPASPSPRWAAANWPVITPTPDPVAASAPASPTTVTDNPTPDGGTTVTAPTGEAVNYETTVNELEAMIRAAQSQVDSAQVALQSISDAKNSVDAMQQTYQALAEAAQSKLDHETAMNLDGTTLGHAGTAVDALPPNAVDRLFDELEAMETQVTERQQQSATALASLEAELAHVVETYGEENAKVASHLGGDPTFLGSGGGGGAPAAAVPAAHAPAESGSPVGVR